MGYEQKFAGLLQMCEDAKRKGIECVVVAEPQVLGDTYEELVESLNRISDARLALSIVPRADRR